MALSHNSTQQKVARSSSSNDDNDLFQILNQLSQDNHELKLDLSSVLLEEQLLKTLLERVQCRKNYMQLDQQTPLITTGDDSIRNMLTFLNPIDQCSVDSTCKTLQRISQQVWKHRAAETITSNNNKNLVLLHQSQSNDEKTQFLKFFLASSKAKQWEEHAARHTCTKRHGHCRGCSNFPNHLDTKPLHNVGDYDFFLRMSHQEYGLLFEGFVPVLLESDLIGESDDTQPDIENDTNEWAPPSHPQILLSKLLEHLPLWKTITKLASSSLSDDDSNNKAFENAIQKLVSKCAITLLAIPHDDSKHQPKSSKSPILIVSTRGNKDLIEPRESFMDNATASDNEEEGDDDEIEKPDNDSLPLWNMPLEPSRMAAHFVDSADHVRSYVSELQTDLIMVGTDRLILDFPDILIYPSSNTSNASMYNEYW